MSFEAVAPACGVANVCMWPWCDGCAPKSMGHLPQMRGSKNPPRHRSQGWDR